MVRRSAHDSELTRQVNRLAFSHVHCTRMSKIVAEWLKMVFKYAAKRSETS